MRLYAKIEAARGGRIAAKGDDKLLTITLTRGNDVVGVLKLGERLITLHCPTAIEMFNPTPEEMRKTEEEEMQIAFELPYQ